MKRAALIAGISIFAVSAAPTNVRAWTGDLDLWSSGYRPVQPYSLRSQQPARPRARKPQGHDRKTDKTPPVPPGLLHIIVSIDKQRATLFADGNSVASTAISSGTPDHPTPMGVFSVIQKSRHHVSNLYNAPMPYMQRITWSGSALHEGPLPGYPASHGCVRLTSGFAQLLWKATKMGARVIVTRPDVAPIAFEHTRLFVPKPQMVEAPPLPKPAAAALALTPATAAESALTSLVTRMRTADATNMMAVTSGVRDDAKAVATPVAMEPAEQPTKLSVTDGADVAKVEVPAAEAKPAAIAAPAPIIVDERPKAMPAAVVREANGRPISVFVSLKESKLYVRQGWKPLFDAPVSFERPNQPIGTHVYTAMGMKVSGDGLRWTVVSIPSSNRRVTELTNSNNGRRGRHAPVKLIEIEEPTPSPNAALDRIVLPAELVERISELITPGSSLIVSDNKLSDETGEYTDFVVLTR
jgi:lipoprotein-anchoring transpeptidase ErfK/SrfK